MAAAPTTKVSPMLIGGEFVDQAASGEIIESINPATGEVCGSFPAGGKAEIDAAVQAAKNAFHSWRHTHPFQRAALMQRFASLIAEHAEELAQIDVMDNGSPISHMSVDARTAQHAIGYMAGLVLETKGQTIPGTPGQLNYTLHQPFGVVGRIIPFNHPMMFAACFSAAPLLTGNTIVLKPSDSTSLSTLRLGELFNEVFPPGVVNVVTGYGDAAGDALVTHPDVPRLAFTGSAEIGRRIQERAASVAVKTVSLELGGKNPIIVLPDADIDKAIDGALAGMSFTWQGQSCGSTSRLIVHRSIHEEFVARLGEKIAALRPGMPEDPDTETGAIVHRRQYEKVMGYIELGKDEGFDVVTGGGRPEGAQFEKGLFIEPTLFDNVPNDSRLAQEEIFGPVLVAMPFDSDEQALEMANGTPYGLTASVWTRDLARAHRFARDLEAGYMWVNQAGGHLPGGPHGGIKQSGLGREESLSELYGYTQERLVTINFE